jgi:hypothetical protein
MAVSVRSAFVSHSARNAAMCWCVYGNEFWIGSGILRSAPRGLVYARQIPGFQFSSDKNPTLTILALSWRSSAYLAEEARKGNL